MPFCEANVRLSWFTSSLWHEFLLDDLRQDLLGLGIFQLQYGAILAIALQDAGQQHYVKQCIGGVSVWNCLPHNAVMSSILGGFTRVKLGE